MRPTIECPRGLTCAARPSCKAAAASVDQPIVASEWELFSGGPFEFMLNVLLRPLLIFQGRQGGIWITRRILLDAYRLPLLNHTGRFGHVFLLY